MSYQAVPIQDRVDIDNLFPLMPTVGRWGCGRLDRALYRRRRI
ncbi:MAG: hypothetical protein CM15mP84_00120 [Cellvibrionales bacterium]|nr:MAG: hypothetical protein CM15mP84_00120 [Cellvibrionales bacterium]